MKTIILCALAVLGMSQAVAQTATTSISNLSPSKVYDANGNCLAGGITGITISGTSVSYIGASAAACGTSTAGQAATVNVTWPATTYVAGTTPTVSWSSTASVPCTASVSPTLATTTSSSTSVTFAAPATPPTGTQQNYVFSLSCAAPTGYTSVNILPTSTSNMSVGTTPTPGNCAQITSDTPVPLTRQCTGTISYFGVSGVPTYTGPLTDLTTILSSPTYRYNTFMNLFSGATMIANVKSGQYVSFAITPTTTGSIQLSANTSLGDGGALAVGTKPGQFMIGNPDVICSQNTGSGNSIIFSTVPGSQCQMTAGTTYYVSMADVNLATGDELCFNHAKNSCATSSSTMSYIIYVSKVQ